jgi:ribosome maturation factor RimP
MEESLKTREKLVEIIEPLIKDSFMELVDLEILPGRQIRVVIDRTQGKVSIEDCADISRKIGDIPGLEDVVKGVFSLEVSSPGIDRPLKKRDDFLRFKGSKVKIVTHQPVNNLTFFIGLIRDIEVNDVIIAQDGKETRIDLANVKKANLEIDVF